MSLATVSVLVVCAALVVPPHPFALLAAIFLLVASALVTRKSADAWFDNTALQEVKGD